MRFKLSIISLIIILAAVGYILFSLFQTHRKYSGNNGPPSDLAVIGENLLFVHRDKERLPTVITHNMTSGVTTALDLPGYNLLNPRQTGENNSFFISAYPKNLADALLTGQDPEFLLLHCDVESFDCKKIFSFNRSIDTPFRLKSGRILFSSDVPRLFEDENKRKRLLWIDPNLYRIVDSTTAVRLTDFQEHSIGIAGKSENLLFFNMEKSPSRFNRSLKRRGYDITSSSIFAAKINDSEQLSFDEDINMLKPHVTIGHHNDNSAEISIDGAYISLLSLERTRSIDKNRGVGSDIVVLETKTLEEKYRITPKKNSMISRSTFGTENSLFYIEMRDGNYVLLFFDFLNFKNIYSKELDDLTNFQRRILKIVNH